MQAPGWAHREPMNTPRASSISQNQMLTQQEIWIRLSLKTNPDYSCMKLIYTLNSVLSIFLMPSLLLYPKILGNGCPQSKSHSLLPCFPSRISWFLTLNKPPRTSSCHHCNHCHYCNVNLCNSIMSQATLICFYHSSMLTLLYDFVISYTLWLPQV